MTIGKISPKRGLLLGLLLLLVAAGAGAAPSWDLPQLMSALREHPHVQARFVETKHLALLEGSLEVSGTLEFRAPDYLRRSQLKPRVEEFEVRGDVVTVRRPGEPPRQIALAEYPPLAAFIASIRATLAGDLEGLERHYETTLSGSAQSWQLRLEPRPGPVADYIESMSLRGEHGVLLEIETQELTGDYSVIRILPLDENPS